MQSHVLRASIFFYVLPISSRKEMFSIGGIRHQDAAYELTFRMIASGCLWQFTVTLQQQETPECLTNTSATLTADP